MTFKQWKLACSRCDDIHIQMDWDYNLPPRCRCGGYYYDVFDAKKIAIENQNKRSSSEAEILSDLEMPHAEM